MHVCICMYILGQRRTVVEHTDLKIQAKVGTICMKIVSDCREISAFYIDGITAGFTMKASNSQANITLSSISIIDLNAASAYKDVRQFITMFLHSLYIWIAY